MGVLFRDVETSAPVLAMFALVKKLDRGFTISEVLTLSPEPGLTDSCVQGRLDRWRKAGLVRRVSRGSNNVAAVWRVRPRAELLPRAVDDEREQYERARECYALLAAHCAHDSRGLTPAELVQIAGETIAVQAETKDALAALKLRRMYSRLYAWMDRGLVMRVPDETRPGGRPGRFVTTQKALPSYDEKAAEVQAARAKPSRLWKMTHAKVAPWLMGAAR